VELGMCIASDHIVCSDELVYTHFNKRTVPPCVAKAWATLAARSSFKALRSLRLVANGLPWLVNPDVGGCEATPAQVRFSVCLANSIALMGPPETPEL